MARAIRETWDEPHLPHTHTHTHTHTHKRIVPINSRLFRRWPPRECNEESFEGRFLRKISRSYFSSFTLSLPSRASPFDVAAPRSFTRDSFLPSLGFSIIRTAPAPSIIANFVQLYLTGITFLFAPNDHNRYPTTVDKKKREEKIRLFFQSKDYRDGTLLKFLMAPFPSEKWQKFFSRRIYYFRSISFEGGGGGREEEDGKFAGKNFSNDSPSLTRGW